MEYLYGALFFFGFVLLTPMLCSILGVWLGAGYIYLGIFLSFEHWVYGVGGLLGALINLYGLKKVIPVGDTNSQLAIRVRMNSIWYILSYLIVFISSLIFKFKFEDISWQMLIALGVLYILYNLRKTLNEKVKLERLKKSVQEFQIIEKYNEDPKWAIMLYCEDGSYDWNKTIPGSYLAKDPANGDLTFVFYSKEEAINYARHFFSEATDITE